MGLCPLCVQWGLDYTSSLGGRQRLLRAGLPQWRLCLVLTLGPFGGPNSAGLRHRVTYHMSVQWGLDHTSSLGGRYRLLSVGLPQWRL